MQTKISLKTKGLFYGAISAACYGLIPTFTLPIYHSGVSMDSILFLRYVLATLLLASLMKYHHISFAITKKEGGILMTMGLLFSLSSVTLFQSYRFMDAGIASTILFIYPILVALIMIVFYKEKVSFMTFLSMGISFLGIILLSQSADGHFLAWKGMVLVLLSSLTYAVYIVAVNKSNLKAMPVAKLTFYVLLFGLMVFVVRLHFLTDLQFIKTPLLYINLLSLAIFPTIISLTFLSKAVQCIGSTKTAILGALEPVTAMVCGVVIFHESFTLRIFCGVVFILIGITLIVENGSDFSKKISLEMRHLLLPKPRKPKVKL